MNAKNSWRLLSRPLVLLALLLLGSGCTVARPHFYKQYETPIDWGLKSSFNESISIEPFTLPPNTNPEWGQWAARRMQQYLLEERAFQRVVLSEKGKSMSPLVLKADITQLYYGGTFAPSRIDASIRIISLQDGQTRFLRTAHVTGEKKGINLELLTRAYVSSPYPEEILDKMLKEAAHDIAQRTRSND